MRLALALLALALGCSFDSLALTEVVEAHEVDDAGVAPEEPDARQRGDARQPDAMAPEEPDAKQPILKDAR